MMACLCKALLLKLLKLCDLSFAKWSLVKGRLFHGNILPKPFNFSFFLYFWDAKKKLLHDSERGFAVLDYCTMGEFCFFEIISLECVI